MSETSLCLLLQARRVLLQLMIDVAILLGANATTAQADMEAALEFEIKVAEVCEIV